MTKSMNPKVRKRLELYRRDYEQVEGKPFKHFFCPILGADEPIVEPTELIRGHIINQSFENAPSAWVVQRSDVDNFYGSNFEADFETLQYRNKLTPIGLLTDKTLCKKFNPKILLNNQPVEFTSQPSPPPGQFVRVELGEGPHTPSIGIKMNHEEFIKAAGEQWEFTMVKDVRIPALVSLIKAAHLTTFHLLGYRYATAAAGLLMGRDVLGKFYRQNFGRPRKDVLANASSYFREFANTSRPLLHVEVGYQGTVADRRVLVCFATSGQIWAQIVLVRTADRMHAVMLPVFDSIDSVPTFLSFLKNDNERIEVATGEFDTVNRRWTIYGDRRQQHWPKQGILDGPIPDPIEFPRLGARATLP
jgi:hypothetical protein